MTKRAIALVLLSACTGGVAKDRVETTFEDGTRAEAKADGATSIVGSLTYGQRIGPVKYTSRPRYRFVKFAGDPGDVVDVWVTSSDGDAVAWVVDNDFNTLGFNDDADDTTFDAHIQIVLGESASRTHYIAFREYFLARARFTVTLDGGDMRACAVDADCERVHAGCCPSQGGWEAIRVGFAAAFRGTLGCAEELICPAVLPKEDHSMAECNRETKRCEAVHPDFISCGGLVPDPHACPEGWSCRGAAADDAGACRRACDASSPCDDEHACRDGWCERKDCRDNGCDPGQLCTWCWASYACIPEGAVC